MNYWVIAFVILGCYIAHRLALRKAQREKSEAWMYVALAMMVLEVEARKAEARQAAKDRASHG